MTCSPRNCSAPVGWWINQMFLFDVCSLWCAIVFQIWDSGSSTQPIQLVHLAVECIWIILRLGWCVSWREVWIFNPGVEIFRWLTAVGFGTGSLGPRFTVDFLPLRADHMDMSTTSTACTISQSTARPCVASVCYEVTSQFPDEASLQTRSNTFTLPWSFSRVSQC